MAPNKLEGKEINGPTDIESPGFETDVPPLENPVHTLLERLQTIITDPDAELRAEALESSNSAEALMMNTIDFCNNPQRSIKEKILAIENTFKNLMSKSRPPLESIALVLILRGKILRVVFEGEDTAFIAAYTKLEKSLGIDQYQLKTIHPGDVLGLTETFEVEVKDSPREVIYRKWVAHPTLNNGEPFPVSQTILSGGGHKALVILEQNINPDGSLTPGVMRRIPRKK